MKSWSIFRNLFFVAGLAWVGPASIAIAGGVTDGGGNAGTARNMTSDEIRSLLAGAKSATLHILQPFDIMWNGMGSLDGVSRNEIHRSLRDKLFRGPKTVYQALAEARFSPIEAGGCLDLDSKYNDASALKSAPEICFSLERLTKKLYVNSGKVELLALVAHEVSHLVGTTEPEAQALQDMIRNRLSSLVFERIQDLGPDFRAKLGNARHSARDLLAASRDGNFENLCIGITDLAAATRQVWELNMNLINDPGVSFLSAADASLLAAASLKSLNLFSACAIPHSWEFPKEKIVQAFAGKSEMDIRDYANSIYGDSNRVYPLPSLRIRFVPRGHLEPLLAETQDILNILDQLEANIAKAGLIN